jgi:hypothetical protein
VAFAELADGGKTVVGSYTLQYIGAADDINAAPTDIGAKAPAVTYHSAQLKYAFSKQLDFASASTTCSTRRRRSSSPIPMRTPTR